MTLSKICILPCDRRLITLVEHGKVKFLTDDEEITLHGFIDTDGRPIGKFRLYRRKR